MPLGRAVSDQAEDVSLKYYRGARVQQVFLVNNFLANLHTRLDQRARIAA
jgi:hypothetical protein